MLMMYLSLEIVNIFNLRENTILMKDLSVQHSNYVPQNDIMGPTYSLKRKILM